MKANHFFDNYVFKENRTKSKQRDIECCLN